MNTTWALIRREARDSRISLIAAPLVSAAVLCLIHGFFELPFAVSQAAAMAVLILIPVWTLYFGADLFATDCASGRMSTKSLLPVSALELWTAKILFFALTIISLSAGVVGFELLLQHSFGTVQSVEHLTAQMLFSSPVEVSIYASLVFLLGATAVLSSLLVENALVAMLLSLIAAAALGGIGWALRHAFALTGIELGGAQWLALGVAVTAILLGLSATAFMRGQRKLGVRLVRTRFVLARGSALVAIGGISTAAIVYRGVITGLEHPLAQYGPATGSPDGRHLALAVRTKLSRDAEASNMVWMIDLETGRRDLVTNSGFLNSDRYSAEPLPWDSENSLRMRAQPRMPWNRNSVVLRVEAAQDGVMTSRLDSELPLDSRWVPHWAEVTRSKYVQGNPHVLNVRWRERAIERVFTGEGISTWVGRSVYLSPTPGRLVVLRDGRVTLVDLAPESERVLVEQGVKSMRPSPDGSALLVCTDDATTALSGVDGAPLHEAWREKSYVDWVPGEGGTRVVRVVTLGVVRSQSIVDLDTHAEFEMRLEVGHSFMHRLGDHGFVCEDGNDLVWVDSKGALVKVLVDR